MARRGIAGDGNREIQLGGEGNLEKECRSNIETGHKVKKETKEGKQKGFLGTIRCFSALPLTSGVFWGMDFLPVRGQAFRSLRPEYFGLQVKSSTVPRDYSKCLMMKDDIASINKKKRPKYKFHYDLCLEKEFNMLEYTAKEYKSRRRSEDAENQCKLIKSIKQAKLSRSRPGSCCGCHRDLL